MVPTLWCNPVNAGPTLSKSPASLALPTTTFAVCLLRNDTGPHGTILAKITYTAMISTPTNHADRLAQH
jgi:hypothetical protein